ncbi:MAG: phenylalanine--tRNA ligase beta subunit-related protein, partial [Spirochaetia bacterium]|nr:phenylalanine--tRNA ligase beta subunit-related protein [Spirochaetia bacterium]
TEEEALYSVLKETLIRRFENPVDLENDRRITDWKEVHKSFSSNPNKFPPAHIALLKRIQKQQTEIPFINSVVAVMNTVSIENILPVGGDDIISPESTYMLTFSDGTENFIPLGTPDKSERPDEGEVIYLIDEAKEVMCRRWNWRNSDRTKITEKTENIIMNIDAVGQGSDERAEKARDMVAEMLEKYCGAQIFKTILTPEYSRHVF